jgi:thiosulfate/3-mercaptopyruvate sulfurtransferase
MAPRIAAGPLPKEVAVIHRLSRAALSRRSFSLGVALVALALPGGTGAGSLPETAWVIAPEHARGLIAEGALLLDTRPARLRLLAPLAGSVRAEWQEFTNPDLPDKGRLLDDNAALTARLRALGVRRDRAVVVVADPTASWGEDGRIVWTLRTLGHPQAHLVDGGVAALLAAGPVTPAPVTPGDFTVARTDAYDITKEDLAARMGRPGVVILDTREAREFRGATPYGESRGGHVPGAKHVFYRDLLDGRGMVLSGSALQARLSALGITQGTEVISYCSAGIRSGFVTAVLQSAGITARNYSGSMWEWAAQPEAAYPLVTD